MVWLVERNLCVVVVAISKQSALYRPAATWLGFMVDLGTPDGGQYKNVQQAAIGPECVKTLCQN